MANQLTVDTAESKIGRGRLAPALILLALLVAVAAALFASWSGEAPAPAEGAIEVPKMKNVPPADQKVGVEVEEY